MRRKELELDFKQFVNFHERKFYNDLHLGRITRNISSITDIDGRPIQHEPRKLQLIRTFIRGSSLDVTMTDQNDTPRITLRTTKKGDGYTVMRKDSYIPTEHFNTLKTNKIMQSFISKNKETGEQNLTKSGKPLWINYIPQDKFGDLQQFCQNNNLQLEVAPEVPAS